MFIFLKNDETTPLELIETLRVYLSYKREFSFQSRHHQDAARPQTPSPKYTTPIFTTPCATPQARESQPPYEASVAGSTGTTLLPQRLDRNSFIGKCLGPPSENVTRKPVSHFFNRRLWVQVSDVTTLFP